MRALWRFGQLSAPQTERWGALLGVRRMAAPPRGGFEFALPPIPAGHILVPSYCATALGGIAVYRHAFTLRTAEGIARLASVGDPSVPDASKGDGLASSSIPSVTTAVDCFETSADTGPSSLHIEWHGDPPRADAWWLSITVRPVVTQVHAGQLTVMPTSAPPQRRAMSQMRLSDDIKQRVCSPVSLTMALHHIGLSVDLDPIIEAALHPSTGMYGVWPQNVYAAGRVGALATVELAHGMDEVLQLVARGAGVVCSLRWKEGALPSAPLPHSNGHLIWLLGADHTQVFVHDPAAPDDESVARAYPRAAFVNAWLRERGAYYLLLPVS